MFGRCLGTPLVGTTVGTRPYLDSTFSDRPMLNRISGSDRVRKILIRLSGSTNPLPQNSP